MRYGRYEQVAAEIAPSTGRRESFLTPPRCDMQSGGDSLQSNRSSEF